MRCVDCHNNIHAPYLEEKYYPEENCKNCHDESRWNKIDFDHSITNFELLGKHQKQTCRNCHFKKDEAGLTHQRFAGLANSCTNCHSDIHNSQFEENGITDCVSCHDFNNWKASKFDHSKTDFKLEGVHEQLACKDCHKPTLVERTNYIVYKIKNFRCEDCHK